MSVTDRDSSHRLLALDIGGANIKYVTPQGAAKSSAFALWQRPEHLSDELSAIVQSALPIDAVLVTMTGELCDAFEIKEEGVRAILDALVRAVAAAHRGKTTPRPTLVWTTEERFVHSDAARQSPRTVAAANWLALAHLAGQFAPEGKGVLIDVGSTTTDVVPLLAGRPVAIGRTDPERLVSGELVYLGAERTPIASLVEKLEWNGQPCPIARELFATSLDAHLMLRKIDERPRDRGTADGRAATRSMAHARLSRMVCADRSLLDGAGATEIARRVYEREIDLIATAIDQVRRRHQGQLTSAVVSGSGEFLAHDAAVAAGLSVISLSAAIGNDASRAACAVALQQLASTLIDADLQPAAALE